jgi:hypothetical protein
MRLIIDAERPLALWLPLRIVQAVLRGSPKILACSTRMNKEAAGFDRLSQFPDFGRLARKAARAPYLREGFELVHADCRGERRRTR